MYMMKGTIIIASVAVAVTLGLLVFIHESNRSAQKVKPPSPAPVLTAPGGRADRTLASEKALLPPPSESPTNEPAATSVWARFGDGDVPKLTREEVEPFLAKNHRSVEALLGALRACEEDDELLKEAKERFPNDPRVQFAAAFKSDSPQEQREWLEKLKASAPDNALANYLLASGHFKSGETGQALSEAAAASAKPVFENYLVDFIQNAEEAYRAGGYPSAEAKAAAGIGALLPELGQLKSAGVELAELAKKYQQAGDDASARAVLDMALTLGHRLDQTPQVTLIQELVGVAIERIALSGMNPGSPYGQAGQTVQDQIDALAARRKAMRALASETEPILMGLSDEDTAHYFDRSRMFGEVAALRWVRNKAPQP
jgi:hypothetical protein